MFQLNNNINRAASPIKLNGRSSKDITRPCSITYFINLWLNGLIKLRMWFCCFYYKGNQCYCSKLLCLSNTQRLKSLITNEAKKSLSKNHLTKTLTKTPSFPGSTLAYDIDSFSSSRDRWKLLSSTIFHVTLQCLKKNYDGLFSMFLGILQHTRLGVSFW